LDHIQCRPALKGFKLHNSHLSSEEVPGMVSCVALSLKCRVFLVGLSVSPGRLSWGLRSWPRVVRSWALRHPSLSLGLVGVTQASGPEPLIPNISPPLGEQAGPASQPTCQAPVLWQLSPAGPCLGRKQWALFRNV
jgi:hypothetical protein